MQSYSELRIDMPCSFYKFLTLIFHYILLLSSLSYIAVNCSDRYTEKIPAFKVTVPRKVSEEGSFISHYLPHFYNVHRRKRELSSEVVSYVIPLDRREYLLHLWPSTDYLSPSLVVERHSPSPNNRSRITVRGIPATQCHYRGVISGMEGSRVAMSTCYGLAGHLVMPNDEFFIEPSLDENRLGEYHKHYVYKREDVMHLGNRTNCGTTGPLKEALTQRLDWELKYGKKVEKTIRSNLLNEVITQPRLNRSKRVGGTCPTDATTCCPLQKNSCHWRSPHFLEVMITIDAKLENLFYYDLETFIFTVFNMVAANFQDESIGEPVNIQLIRILYLTYTLPRLDTSRFAPSLLLQNFCDWQLEMNPLYETHPNHHDVAIFITRFEPCQGSVLGLTNMASLCRLDKTCIIASEEGLLLANIITHQLGHSMGAEHDDGEVGGCVGEESDGTIYHMAPRITTSSRAWSICSKQSIGAFIKSRMSWCLTGIPRDHVFRSPDILPGQVYDAIQQCSLNFKMKTFPCETDDFCKVLYCQLSPNKCVTTGDPPASGTPCAMGMWCYRGDCVQVGQRPGSTDGGWGPWSDWSPCTRSCGGGVQTRFRGCDSPAPARGGRTCPGSWVTHRMCSTGHCASFASSFWDVQCKMTNKRPYKGHYFFWDHFQPIFEDFQCTLVCINDNNEVVIRSPVVIDGTPCMPGTNNVCISGVCRRVGCDFVIESKSKIDMCGICHGTGTGCKVVQGIFYKPNLEGMEDFLKLPLGTGMIYIRELDTSSCYLIISSSYNQTFYLNGPTFCDHLPGEFHVAGVTGVYDHINGLEKVFIQRCIKSAITISVVCKSKGENNSGFRFQYALPEAEESCYIPTYKWAFLHWDACSRLCGGGVQRASPSCVEIKGGEVEDRFCYDHNKPVDQIRNCNTKPCVAKWWIGAWSDCDCTDGEGIMTRVVFCMKPHLEDFSLSKIVKDKECLCQPKPKVVKPCNLEKSLKLDRPQDRPKRQVQYNYDYARDLYDNGIRSRESNEFMDYGFQTGLIEEDVLNDNYVDETTMEVKINVPKKHSKRGRIRHGNLKRKHFSDNFASSDSINHTDRMEISTLSVSLNGEEDLLTIHPKSNRNPNAKHIKNNQGKNIIIEVINSDKSGEDLTTSSVTTTTSCRETQTMVEENGQYSSQDGNVCGTTDFFLEHVFPHTMSITCSPNATGIEPADLGPRVEYANSSLYKIYIAPLLPNPGSMTKTDVGVSIFGNSMYFRPSSMNKTPITGGSIFKILQEARKRATLPPVIDFGDY